jgi:CDP-glycerol glycerophosphotransferase
VASISVIIPVYRVADYLDRCLDSVLGQSGAGSEIEVIAVDDASPDGCGAILAARRDPRLRVLRTEATVGPGGARELGLKEAAGEYLWFVDADDELADGALAEVAARLDRLHPDILVVDYENIYADGTVTPSGADLATPELTTLADSPGLLNVTSSMWTKVIRRDFLSGLGLPFGPGIYEDVPVALAASLAAARIGVLNRVCYRYRRSRPGSYMAEISDRHFDMFATYETVYAFAKERDGQLTTAVRAELFARTIRHYVFALPKVPRSRRHDFFRLMTRDYRRWRPDGYAPPPGPRGVELRLVGRGAYRTYCALIPLNRFRLALRQRLR